MVAGTTDIGAVELQESGTNKKASVNPVLCKGDGLCNSVCPTGAITLKHFTDEEFLSQIDAAMGDVAGEHEHSQKGDKVA